MNDSATQATAEQYLDSLATELAAAPAERRTAIVDDIRAHIADALEAGRPLPEVLAGLGAPQGVAADALADIPRPVAAIARPFDTAARILLLAATAVGVVTAAFVSFLMPAETATPGVGPTATFSLVDVFGFGVVLLTLVPAALAVLPLLLPLRMRAAATLAGAVVVVLLSAVAGFYVGSFYVPLAMLLFAAVIVPRLADRGVGPVASRVWRAVAAALLLLPAVLMVTGLIAGSILFEWGPVLWITLAVTSAIFVIARSRVGHMATAALGAAVLVLALIDGGMLLIAFWWAGGIYLTVGLIGWLLSSPHKTIRSSSAAPELI